jgi:hypothetical protein
MLEPYLEGSSHRTYHSAMINVYFMYRRFLMVLVFIFFQEYPSFQVTILTVFTVINFLYTAAAKPYQENNLCEIMNETAILLCGYLMNVFFQSDDPEFSEIIGWVFIAICA